MEEAFLTSLAYGDIYFILPLCHLSLHPHVRRSTILRNHELKHKEV